MDPTLIQAFYDSHTTGDSAAYIVEQLFWPIKQIVVLADPYTKVNLHVKSLMFANREILMLYWPKSFSKSVCQKVLKRLEPQNNGKI